MLSISGGFWGAFWPALLADLAAGGLVGVVLALAGPRIRDWFRNPDLELYVTQIEPDVDVEQDVYSMQAKNTGSEPFDLDIFWHLAAEKSLRPSPHSPEIDRAAEIPGKQVQMCYFSGKHSEPLYPTRKTELFTFTVNPDRGESGIVTGYVSTQFGTYPESNQENVKPDQLPQLTTILALRDGT